MDKTVCGMEIKMEKKRTRRMKMAMLCYVLAALCLVYCVGVVATKAAGTKFYRASVISCRIDFCAPVRTIGLTEF